MQTETLADIVREMLAYEAAQFDGPEDEDLSVSGADLVDAFTEWRARLKTALAAPPAELPENLPGHWQTKAGLEMATEYAGWGRDRIGKRDLTDFELANAVFMASRDDLDLIVYQTAAKERIRWLSVHLALAQMECARLRADVSELVQIDADLSSEPFIPSAAQIAWAMCWGGPAPVSVETGMAQSGHAITVERSLESCMSTGAFAMLVRGIVQCVQLPHAETLYPADCELLANIRATEGQELFGTPPQPLGVTPPPPFPIGPATNCKRRGWEAFFSGASRDACPFPPSRRDLKAGYEEGWDAAQGRAHAHS